jgi:cation transport ATPase
MSSARPEVEEHTMSHVPTQPVASASTHEEVDRSSARHRAPLTVWAAAVLTFAIALVTSYGAVYFSLFWEQAPPRSLGTWSFAAAFVAIAVLGAASAVALLRGSDTARKVLIGYAVFGVLFTAAKLIWWQETEALVFGGLDVVLILLATARSTRAHVGRGARP